MMQLKITLMVTLIASLLLAGCNIGSGGFTYPYDGVWTASYNNAADWPVAGTNQTVACTKPAVALTILKGTGSTKQVLTCTITTTTPAVIDPFTGAEITPAVVTSVTWKIDYLISVSISETGVTNAIVNGYPLDGTCISTIGCSALSGSTALSLTR